MDSAYSNEYHDPLSFVGYGQQGYYATSGNGHLMPNPLMDPNSSNCQSSLTSPVSPCSCPSADFLAGGTALPEADTDFYLYDNPTNDISPTLPMDAGYVPSTERLSSTIVPQIPHLHCPQSVSSPDPLDNVRADLNRLQSTVQSSVRNVSRSQLFGIKSLVRDTYNCLETMIQDEIDCEIHSPNSTNSTNSNRDRYICQLCELYKRKTYATRGSFRRHVSTEHVPRYRYFCPLCDWDTCRRDKVWEHFRLRHPPPAKLRPNDIKHTKLRPPRDCPLCKKSVQSWEAYFNCVSEHCRIQSGSSPATSGVQSRRNSGDSGSGGDGFNGHIAPGNPFNGHGLQTQFPNGGGNNPNNGDNYFSGYGSYCNGNGYSRESNFAQMVEQRLSHPLSSVPDRDDASPDPTLFSHNPGKKASGIRHMKANSLSVHHQLLDSTIQRNPQATTPMDHSGHHSGRKAPQHPRGPSETTSFNNRNPHLTTSFKDLSPKESQGRPASEPQNLPPEKCKSCGHMIENCVECKLRKGTGDRCHLCTGKASQQHGALKVLEEYDQYYDFACNGMSDRSRSASKIAWALEQVSLAFKPKDGLCLTRISRAATGASSDESSRWVSVMKAIDTAYELHVSEQSTFKFMGSGSSTMALSSVWEAHATRSRFITMTLALCSPQIYNKFGHSGSLKGIHIKLSEVLYDTRNITGDTSVAYNSEPQKVAAPALAAEQAIPLPSKTSESSCTIQSKIMSFNNYQIRALSVGPCESGALSLYAEPTALKTSRRFTFCASSVVKDRQSSQRSNLLVAPDPAKVQLTRRRHSRLRKKLQVIIEILVLQASVAHTLPVLKQLKDRNLRNSITESADTDLVEVGSDLDSSDPNFLPQWLRDTISTFSAGLIDNVESTMLATPMYKAEEEIWPKVKTFVGSMASYLETPVSPTVIEQHIADFRKLRMW